MGGILRRRIFISEREIGNFVAENRTLTIASFGPNGHIHLVAMWYVVVDGQICFATKVKAQKVTNLRRNPQCSILIETGDTYDELRGVSFEGLMEISEEPELRWKTGVNLWERYNGPYSEDVRPLVEGSLSGAPFCVSPRPGRDPGITAK